MVSLEERSYPIYIGTGVLNNLQEWIKERRCFLVTDDHIPQKWVDLVASQLHPLGIFVLPHGEANKTFDNVAAALEAMAASRMNRKDAVVALGGGVVGDLAGFAASIYMRGIDFYNIPTTVLAQVDSSVGGKTAVDLGPYKNLVGAFWQPKAVFIDPQVLSTLSKRHIANGLVEALKMGLILDENLVEEFEKENPDLEKIITRSIELKARVVEEDEKELGLRKILNFGHTIGHAMEGAHQFAYLHGECVAYGMLCFLPEGLRERVRPIYERIGLILPEPLAPEKILDLLVHDKKGSADGCDVIVVSKAGQAEIIPMSWNEILARTEV